jgi:hypothetical protein
VAVGIFIADLLVAVVDTALGTGVALLVGSMLFPVDPIGLARASAEPLLERLAAALDQIADALDARDLDHAERRALAASVIRAHPAEPGACGEPQASSRKPRSPRTSATSIWALCNLPE